MNLWDIGLAVYLALGILGSAVTVGEDKDSNRRLWALVGSVAAVALAIHFLG